MPNFPAFQKRLAQANNPFYRSAAEDTPMEFGIPVRPAMGPSQGINQLRRPKGAGGSIPLVQDVSQIESSGTSSDQPMMSASRTKQAIANQVNYEDLKPQLEEIPGDPAFDQHSKHGFKDRLKAMFMGAAGAQAQQPGNQFAGVGGMIGGLINPGGAERLNYEEVVLPRARAKQQATVQRNDSRMKAFRGELDARLATAKINEANKPEYASMAGGEYSTLYNKANPDDQRLVMGPDGKPQRVASVVNTEERTNLLRELQAAKEEAAKQSDARRAEREENNKLIDQKVKEALEEQSAKHKKELEAYRQGQMNYRSNKSEGGKNYRFNKGEAGKNDRFNKGLAKGYGDNGAADPSSSGKKTSAPPAN